MLLRTKGIQQSNAMSEPTPQRVAVFGGTFDPVHLGHLILAEQAREQARLDQVWFVPAASPPHKQGQPITPFAQRVEMLSLALAGNPAFRIDELEKDRPGPSFTADTLAELHRLHPRVDLHLLIGADCLPDLPGWHEPARILELAGLLVAARPNWPVPTPAQLRSTLPLADGVPLRFQVVLVPLIDTASRDLRRRAAEGRSLRYLVPRAVECYINEKHLYKP
jgi:nicotinate-nucleotide adenylyltransferase